MRGRPTRATALGVGGILVETKYKDRWQQTETGRAVLAFWEKANLLYAGGRITNELYNIASKAQEAAILLKNGANAEERAALEETETQANNVIRSKQGNPVQFSILPTPLVHIVENDIKNLDEVISVLRTDGNQAINNVRKLVNENRALVVAPETNSVLKQKVEDYVTAFINKNSTSQGDIGEEIGELMAKELNATGDVLNIKVNDSQNGFDILSFAPDKTNPTSIRIFEVKPLNGTSVELKSTVNSGPQMSNTWIQNNITLMINHSDPAIHALGNTMLQNASKIEKFVLTVDKDLKQVIILKLDNF